MSLWRRFVWLDAIVGLASIWLLRDVDRGGVLHAGDANSLYGSIIGACGGVTAFVVTAIAIVLALSPGTRLKALLEHASNRRQLRRAMTWSAFVNLGACVLCIIGLAVDGEAKPIVNLRQAATAVSLTGLAATFRALWLCAAVLVVHDEDSAD